MFQYNLKKICKFRESIEFKRTIEYINKNKNINILFFR